MKTNYVLIDFENVQPATLKMLDQEHFKVIIFVGAKQKLAIDLAASIHQIGERAEYVKISGDGPNALDFHIAFYIGQIAALEPGAYFHIISKDTGFDSLIKHLKNRKIFANRVPDVNDIPILKTEQATSLSERLSLVVENLKKRKDVVPSTVQTLSNAMRALFGNKLSEPEIEAIIQELQHKKYISVDENKKVSYNLPA